MCRETTACGDSVTYIHVFLKDTTLLSFTRHIVLYQFFLELIHNLVTFGEGLANDVFDEEERDALRLAWFFWRRPLPLLPPFLLASSSPDSKLHCSGVLDRRW
jgi:hypothetical protein